MSYARIALFVLFGSYIVQAYAACESKNAAQVADLLTRGIELNERFKESVNSGDDAKYRSLRTQVEQYDEETAMPCVRRAQVLLVRRGGDHALLRKLMEFAVSHENSADETVSMAMAMVFATRPYNVEVEWKNFSEKQREILLRSIESGWDMAEKSLSAAQRLDRETRLRVLRDHGI